MVTTTRCDAGCYRRTVLRIAARVMVRPVVGGCIVMTNADRPVFVEPLHEQILAVCQRPSDTEELVDVLSEVGGYGSVAILQAIRDLVSWEFLEVESERNVV